MAKTYEVELSARQLVTCSITVEAEDEDDARRIAIDEASEQATYEWDADAPCVIDDIQIDDISLCGDDDSDDDPDEDDEGEDDAEGI